MQSPTQGATFEELLRNADAIGANAILNICYDDAIEVDTLFKGAVVVIDPISVPSILPALAQFR
ncbi:MAG: hypothetical protein ACRD2P_04675 [Terriglobia bacterium]